MTDYSDKNKPQINMGDYLPEVYKSDINQSLSNVVLDRYLSKDDTIQVTGYVGTGNPQALVKRQIIESSTNPHEQAHRQGFQLAPTVYSKVGTNESALSFKNFCTQLEMQGVDLDRMPIWGSALEFNWIPPINIDMLANYQDYFWAPSVLSDLPQYFTIENRCNKATDKVASFDMLMEQRGTHLVVINIDVSSNSFVIEGNHTNIITNGYTFLTNLSNTPTLLDKYWTSTNVVYNSGSNTTVVTVSETIIPTAQPVHPAIGSWWYDVNVIKTWDSTDWVVYTGTIVAQVVIPSLFEVTSSSVSDNTFTVNGRQDDVFVNGVVFVTTNTTNVNLVNKAWTVASAVFDDANYATIITPVEPISYIGETAPSAYFNGSWWYKPSNGVLYSWSGTSWVATNPNVLLSISLAELLSVIKSDLNCKCFNERGWDAGQWDDNNIGNVAWNTSLLTQISFPSESAWLAYNTGDETMVLNDAPVLFSLWYNTTSNQLLQYGDVTREVTDVLYSPQWNVIMSNFSAILSLTTFNDTWDNAMGCDTQTLNQWSTQNKWQHKNAVKLFSNAKRAQVPILEYDSDIELNEWTQVQRSWKYRMMVDQPFDTVSVSPSRLELEPVKGYQVEGTTTAWYIYLFDKTSTMNANVNLTSVFVPGYRFMIVGDTGFGEVYTVDWSEFRKMDTSSNANLVGNYMATVIKIRENVFISSMVGGVDNTRIVPVETSLGDTWLGYHYHWLLDDTVKLTSPVKTPQMNIFRYADLSSPGNNDAVAGNMAYNYFQPQVDYITHGITYQELTISTLLVTRIDLINSLRYNSSVSSQYATPGSNELRVYVNGVRQYGNYTERTSSSFPSYTMVNNTAESGLIHFVVGIDFVLNNYLKVGDLIRIEVGPASAQDMGMYSVPVRTIESDVDFAAAVVLNNQPIYSSLTEFELNEQSKISVNQYPLFNVYDLLTGDVVMASPIISFTEDSGSPINGSVQRRILSSSNGIEYQFDQHLLDADNNLLYGYRNFSNVEAGQYWYSPYGSTLRFWDGYTWVGDMLLSANTGTVLRTPIISATDPTEYWNIDQTLWVNTVTNTLYRRNVATTNWIVIPNLIVNDADPSLQSVWRHGLNDENYVPRYVNADNQPVAVGSLDGNWELLKQWMYNPEHKNRVSVKLSHLTTHFKTIIEQQPGVQGLVGGGIYTKIQSEYNYGLGGTIKEFNGAFDTLISSVNVINTTPIGVMEFASSGYSAAIRAIRDMFNHSIIDLLSHYTVDTLIDFTAYISDSVITTYEDNEFYARLYSDTSSYNPTTKKGVKNWISTAPMFGLSTLYRPHVLHEGGFMQVYHHDGHRNTVIYTAAEEDALIKKVIKLSDARASGHTMGSSGASVPPSTESSFITNYGGAGVRTGVFWYDTSLPRAFYRLEAYNVGPTHPTFYVNDVEIGDGVMYYNTITHSVFAKNGLNWIAVTAPGSFDLTPLWKNIDLQGLLGGVYLEIETRLYDVCFGTLPSYDYSTLTPNASEQAVYDSKRLKRFNEYVVNYSVPTPFINVQYRQTDAFTWNYITSLLLTPPHTSLAPVPTSCWQSVYTNWYGTPYPHLEPWKLQGYLDKPIWWDSEYLDTTQARRWKFVYDPDGITLGVGMWENIRVGKVPTGRTYPDGRVSTGNASTDGQMLRTYIYFSVNIDNVTIAGDYLPDDLLPPYYSTSSDYNRSLFTNITQVLSPGADYVFGNGSQIEWQWSVSSQSPYEQLIIAYQMQPVRFLRAAFGPRYTFVDKLEVDVSLKQVYNHNDALFHGDMVGIGDTYEARGLNQWYVNFNRFNGFDTSDDFRELWVGWTPLLTYQFNGMIDTNTLDIANKYFDVIPQDYKVVLTNTGAFRDLWIDAFNIGVLSIPPAIIQYNNQHKWKLEINSLASISREIDYYDVKSYPFTVDAATNICHAYRYSIVGVDNVYNRFYVLGDETAVFVSGEQIDVSGSTSVNGNYSVLSSVYEPGNNLTRINVEQTILGSNIDGVINVSNFVFPWATGSMVVLNSTKILPAPLVPNTPYYVVNTGNQVFKLAETFNDSLQGITIDMISSGSGTNAISEIISSFVVMGGGSHSKDTWYHYALDKTKVRTMSPPHVIDGIQTLINIFDGYAEYQHDSGVITNSADSSDFDHNTGRHINWAFEVERFIDWAHGLRVARMNVNDRFSFGVNTTDNTITFADAIPSWVNGTIVQVSSSGSLPAPLSIYETYYVYQTEVAGVIKLSISQDVSYSVFHVDLTTVGSGQLYISAKDVARTYPQFEINPTRNNMWLDTPEGLLSNVVQGPYSDIRVRQTIYDQYGRAINADNLLVYRQDKRSRIAVVPRIQNDVDPFYVDDPYNYIHMGGGHFFVEGYEHYLLFNPYTSDNVLLYDSFLGLYTSKFELTFFKGTDRTLRPTLGGYYLRGHNFYRNIEGAATDLQNFYDAYSGAEDLPNIKRARSLLGYSGKIDYLEMLNVNSKTQFLFYRGMLHAKGSVSSVMAYINSRRFVDAKIDEYWAIKIAEFGDNRVKVFPEVLLSSTDGKSDDVRFEFVGIEDDVTSERIQTAVNDKGFNLITFADDSRWNNFPEQRADIIQPLFLDAELSSVTRFLISDAPPSKVFLSEIDYWYDGSNLLIWNGSDWSITDRNRIHKTSTTVYIRHDAPCDDVRVVRRDANIVARSIPVRSIHAYTDNYISNAFIVLGDVTGDLYNGSIIEVSNADLNSGSYTVSESVYDMTLDITYVVVQSPVTLSVISSQAIINYTYIDFNYYNSVHMIPGDTGTTSYYKVNAETVSMEIGAFYDIIHVYTVRPSVGKLNPAKLVDNRTNVVISQITLWHPAYDIHYFKAIHNIDLYHKVDPAVYSNSLTNGNVVGNVWNFVNVGTTWFDKSMVEYIPYYDDVIYPDINNRLYNWGKLASYSNVHVYQWVRSSVPPSDWDALAIQQQGNLSIDPANKVTGTARKTVYSRTRNTGLGTISFGSATTVTTPTVLVSNGQSVFVTSTSTLPVELQSNQLYQVASASLQAPQTFKLVDVSTGEVINATPTKAPVSVINVGTNNTPIWVFQVKTGIVDVSDQIQFSTIVGGSLPSCYPVIQENTNYKIVDIVDVDGTSYQTFRITTALGASINILDEGIGTITSTIVLESITIVPTFSNQPWVKQLFAKTRIMGAWLSSSLEPVVSWYDDINEPQWTNLDSVDIYINGVFTYNGVLNIISGMCTVSTLGTNIIVQPYDYIDVVRPIHALSYDESNFDPDISDDETILVQWKEDYEYSESVVSIGSNGISNLNYYFWVENSAVNSIDPASMSLLEVTSSLVNMPAPYFVVQQPLNGSADISKYGYDEPEYGTIWGMGDLPEMFSSVPILYREAIIRNISSYINNDGRYMIQFTRDMTLRSSLNTSDTNQTLKNKHSEWLLFRQNQSNNIPILLWNKLTESLSGKSLLTSTPVPSLDRVLYDDKYGTETRYGLNTGQTFVDRVNGIKTVLLYLQSPDRDFAPIDIDNFLYRYDFSKQSDIVPAMTEIYDTFGAEHVNGIWFELLQDALASKAKYKGLMKTSWVALHGIQILGVNGVFDD